MQALAHPFFALAETQQHLLARQHQATIQKQKLQSKEQDVKIREQSLLAAEQQARLEAQVCSVIIARAVIVSPTLSLCDPVACTETSLRQEKHRQQLLGPERQCCIWSVCPTDDQNEPITLHLSQGIECSSAKPHFVCNQCLSEYVLHESRKDLRLLMQQDVKIRCPCSTKECPVSLLCADNVVCKCLFSESLLGML